MIDRRRTLGTVATIAATSLLATTLLAAAASVIAALILATASDPAAAQTGSAAVAQIDSAAADPEPIGVELYATACVSCHGADAAGVADRGPSLLDEGPAAVDFVLRTGRMPLSDPAEQPTRKPAQYTDAEIDALVDYVGGLGTGPAVPTVDIAGADLANGGELFRLNCAACHVATGAGSVIGGDRRAPSLAAADPTEIGEAIIVGPGAMPVFGDLTDTEIDDIAAYVTSLQNEAATGPRGLGGVGPVAEGLAAWALGLVPLIALTRWIGRGRTDDLEPGGAA